MKVISFVNQKGGSGKSTIAINVALELNQRKKTILLDTDTQQSAYQTLVKRDDISCEFLDSPPHKTIDRFSKYDFVVLDSPPHSQEIARSVIISSNIVILPVSDSPLDIHSVATTYDLILEARKIRRSIKAFFLLNRIQPNTTLADQIQEALENLYPKMKTFKTELHYRVDFRKSLIYSQSVVEFARTSRASEEMQSLVSEILTI